MYEYGNIEDAKPGDIVECITPYNGRYTRGKLYILKNIHENRAEVTECDDGFTNDRWELTKFKLVKTKPGSEAKVGDTALYLGDKHPTLESGKPFTVTHICSLSTGNHLGYKSGFSVRPQSCVILCKTATDILYPDSCNTCSETSISPATACSQPTPTIPEEEPMNTTENITIAMTADEYAKHHKPTKTAKPKTDLESASRWITKWYNQYGEEVQPTTQSPKQAKKALQRPDRLGYTFRSYRITASATTDIPVVNVEI